MIEVTAPVTPAGFLPLLVAWPGLDTRSGPLLTPALLALAAACVAVAIAGKFGAC
ncbi:hypothetical protein FHS29_006817 [Saccharothrix tamanrassetensis]|uniref:Uncharacterized protein n=1 Tax=Saccharothrix tamanrassetensis TaxID=1051531 RepID=A0A841CV57_9PSEU|nr:hypothetical protein [Saccharothrix tamanrassetensis]MBB5960194.1 hypothetical protein [Saccharothrix tamanrassetensis]